MKPGVTASVPTALTHCVCPAVVPCMHAAFWVWAHGRLDVWKMAQPLHYHRQPAMRPHDSNTSSRLLKPLVWDMIPGGARGSDCMPMHALIADYAGGPMPHCNWSLTLSLTWRCCCLDCSWHRFSRSLCLYGFHGLPQANLAGDFM